MISYVKALDMLQSYNAWKVSVFGVFLVRIFPHLDWIQRDPPYLSVFSLNAVKYGPEKLQIQTLFTQCYLGWIISNLSTSRSVSFAMELEWEVLLKHCFPVFMCYYLLKAGNSFITWKSWNHFYPLQAKLYDLPIIPSRRNPSLILETSFSGKFHKVYKTSKTSSPKFYWSGNFIFGDCCYCTCDFTSQGVMIIFLITTHCCVPIKNDFNPFSTNVPLMDKPGSWFLLAKCLKNTYGRVTF